MKHKQREYRERDPEGYREYQRRWREKHGLSYPLQGNRFYVYAWSLPGSDVPFYVGRGSNWRATAIHYTRRCNKQPCQIIREANPGCVIDIVAEGLTVSEATRMEEQLVARCYSLGIELTNKKLVPYSRTMKKYNPWS